MSCNQDYLDHERRIITVNGVRYMPIELVEGAREQSGEEPIQHLNAEIAAVVRTWFDSHDDLTHRECDILNSIVSIYKK